MRGRSDGVQPNQELLDRIENLTLRMYAATVVRFKGHVPHWGVTIGDPKLSLSEAAEGAMETVMSLGDESYVRIFAEERGLDTSPESLENIDRIFGLVMDMFFDRTTAVADVRRRLDGRLVGGRGRTE